MDKFSYGVSLGRKEILPLEELKEYEFEIEATPEEIGLLQELIEESEDTEQWLIGRAKTPYEAFPEDDQDEKNLPSDIRLQEVYKLIHRLGVPETKAHIEQMRVLQPRNGNELLEK
ncbi:hypothetical protein N6H14_29810 [Paenibacillus sp. CC-CFT747]|nr:hypothetical protein N6H14_29810 [Paenibacillus sp. CC-CFT747]